MNSIDALQRYFNFKHDANALDSDGSNALFHVTSLETTRILLMQGCNMKLVNFVGKTALTTIVPNTKVYKLILDN